LFNRLKIERQFDLAYFSVCISAFGMTWVSLTLGVLAGDHLITGGLRVNRPQVVVMLMLLILLLATGSTLA
jgi:hypothetical protein